MSKSVSLFSKFWAWTTQARPHWKESHKEAAVLFTVFGITGSTSVALVRPFLKHSLGIEGTMMDGPNSYRLISVVLVSPIYACVLVTVGTIAGRHTYFANMARKIFGRFIPGQALKEKVACRPAIEKAKKSAEEEALKKITR